MKRLSIPVILVLSLLAVTSARERKSKLSSLEEYIARTRLSPVDATSSSVTGSLWKPSAAFADLASDHKARSLGDLVILRISEQLLAESSSSVASQRKLEADSGISSLAGKMDTSGIDSLFSPHSNQSLSGQGQTASKSLLQTAITGRIVAILAGDILVIEAERSVAINNERQRVILRGLARTADIAQDNSIGSNRLGNLEIEVTGKGVISDSTRAPNVVVRWLLRIFGF